MKSHVPGLVVGVVAAALGAAAWAAVAYFVLVEISWLALGIGAMVGYGVGRYSPGVPGFVRGAIAVLLAVGSIVGGKYLSARLYLDKEIETMTALMQSATALSIEVAWLGYLNQHTAEAIEMGRELDWPKGMTYEEAEEEHEYPTEIVAEAAKKWKALSPAERETFRAEWEQWMRENLASDLALVRSKEMMKELFRAMFDRIDIIFGAMAIVAAFSIAKRDDLL